MKTDISKTIFAIAVLIGSFALSQKVIVPNLFSVDEIKSQSLAQVLPSWVPAPGTFANISLNFAKDVDPCPALNCVYSNVSGQEAVFIVWTGGAFSTDFSPYGALLVHGGGHNAYSGNEVYAFDLSTRMWSRVGYPSPYTESQGNNQGEYPDGQPWPPHTYDGVEYLSAANGGGSKGSFLRFGFAGAGINQWIHRMPLTTGANTQGGWVRFNNPPFTQSYFATAFDPSRNVYWVIGTLNSWPNGFGNVTISGVSTLFANQGDNIAGDHVLEYLPTFDMLVHYADCCSSTNGPTLSGKLLSGSAAFSKLNMTGPLPPGSARSGLEWSKFGNYFVSYPGGGSNVVYILTPPTSNPLTGTWTWSTQTLSGVGGAVPIKASGYAAGQNNGHYSRFREVPALSTPGNPTFIYADGRDQPVQLWRLLGGTAVPPPTPPPPPPPAPPPAPPPPPPPSGSSLIGHWTLDGSANDSSGTNNGTLVGGPTFTTGRIGQALSFDGINDYVNLGTSASLNPSSAITLSAWVNLNSNSGSQRFISRMSGTLKYALGMDGTTATLQLNTSGTSGIFGSSPLQPNVWYHIVGTWDGANMRLYLNGNPDATAVAKTGTMSPDSEMTQLGARSGGTQHFLNGKLDDVKIYNYALSQSEVQTLYSQGSGTPPPAPDTQAPTTPTGLSATAVSSSQINLSWNASTDNVGVIGYHIYRNNVNIIDVTGTTYQNTGLSPSTTYTYAVSAYDAAGNGSFASANVQATTQAVPPPPPAGAQDFPTRCAQTGVVRCFGFDAQADFNIGTGGTNGAYGQNYGIIPPSGTADYTRATRDTSIRAEGASSLKFTIPSNSGSDTSGTWFANFSSDLQTQFGENTEFYVQWRQRYSPEHLTNNYQIIGGGRAAGKHISLAAGDTASRLFSSCTANDIIMNEYTNGEFPILYNSCTGSASHGPYDGFFQSISGDFKLQNARPSPFCLYTQQNTSFFPPVGNCFGYFANEWMTYQVHVKTGPRVGDELTNSFVQMWVAREGQSSELVIDWGPYKLSAGPTSDNQRYGKIWLLPYMTNKDPNKSYPVAYTWYDDLVISRNKIADPITSGGTIPLLGDLNADRIINSIDFSIMNGNWLINNATSDLNKDGIVNSLDFSILNGNWLKTY